MQQRKSEPAAVSVSKYLSVGLTSALSTGLFAFLGLAGDRRFDTEPLLTLLGALVGAGAGFYHMYHHLVVVPREQKKRQDGPV